MASAIEVQPFLMSEGNTEETIRCYVSLDLFGIS
jgi:hypothetical protein